MAWRESNTVEAINYLRERYPFATMLLTYALIERELKYFVVLERLKPDPRLVATKVKAIVNHRGVRKDEDWFRNSRDGEFVTTTAKAGLFTLGGVLRLIDFGRLSSDEHLKSAGRQIDKRRNRAIHAFDLQAIIQENWETTGFRERRKSHDAIVNGAIQDLVVVYKLLWPDVSLIDTDKQLCLIVRIPQIGQ